MRSLRCALLLTLAACAGARLGAAPEAPAPALEAAQLEALSQAYARVRSAAARGDWAAVARASEEALALNAGDDSLAYTAAAAWAMAGRSEEAYRGLERLAALGSAQVPQTGDFPGLGGERYERAAQALARNVPRAHAPIAFSLAQRDLIAEGIAHDPKTGTFFVSSIYHRKVVAVHPDGTVRDFAAAPALPLHSTLGLRVDPERRLLWVASAYTPSMKGALDAEKGQSALHKLDLDTGRELARYPRGGDRRPHLLNDLAVARDGSVYVTDSEAGEVLRLPPGGSDFEIVVPAGRHFYPNGITLSDDGRTLFFADYLQGVSALRLDTRELRTLPHPRGVSTHGFDGLYFHQGALVGVENGTGPGRVVRLRLSPGHERVAGAEVLEAAHPLARIPTTGVIADGALHLIVNSQLRAFADGKPLPWEQLAPVHVVRVPLAR
jgi:hypothetical protein